MGWRWDERFQPTCFKPFIHQRFRHIRWVGGLKHEKRLNNAERKVPTDDTDTIDSELACMLPFLTQSKITRPFERVVLVRNQFCFLFTTNDVSTCFVFCPQIERIKRMRLLEPFSPPPWRGRGWPHLITTTFPFCIYTPFFGLVFRRWPLRL